MEYSSDEGDLGLLVDRGLVMGQQYALTAQGANCILDFIGRGVVSGSGEVILPLWSVLV